MVAQSHRKGLSLSKKLNLELALEVRALPLSLADHITSRIIAELEKNVNVSSST